MPLCAPLRARSASRPRACAGARAARRARSFPAGVPRCLRRRLRLRLGHALSLLEERSAFSIRCRSGEKPRSGTSSGKPSNAASGARPTSSASATSARAAHRLDHLAQRRDAVVVHVGRDLRAAAVREVAARWRARRAGRRSTRGGSAAIRRASSRSSLVEVDVERDQRRPGGGERSRRRSGVAARGPKSGTTSPLSIRSASRSPTALPERRRARGARAAWPARRRGSPAPRARRRSGRPR